VSLRSVNALNR